MPTLLPKKNNPQPFATNDDHHTALAADPVIQEFPQGSSFGSQQFSGGNTTNIGQQYNSAPQPDRNAAGSNAAQGADVLVANDNTDWVNKKWRPMMGWMYMATCTADFVIFPVLWSVLQTLQGGQVTSQWNPLTLQGAGLYHIAMGAVLGIAAYGRTKEKVEGKA